MTAYRLLRSSLLFLLSFLLAANAASAEPSLADAVKSLDAKYLAVPDLEQKDTAPKIEAGGGDEDATPAPQEIEHGGVKAALSYIEEKGEEGDVTRIPVVTITADGKEVAKLEGESTGFADPSLRADRGDRSQQFAPRGRGVVFHRRGALLLGHERGHKQP